MHLPVVKEKVGWFVTASRPCPLPLQIKNAGKQGAEIEEAETTVTNAFSTQCTRLWYL